MKFSNTIILGLLMVVPALAEPPPVLKPAPPPPPTALPPPAPIGPWYRIQDSLDRSTGRITDSTTYELDRLNLMRDVRTGRIPDVSDFYKLQAERERALRLDERERLLLQQNPQRALREQMDLREYDLFLNSGVYAASADEDAFNRAKSQRDAALISADDKRRAAIAATPNQRPQIELQYQQQVKQIRQDYEKERIRIFGSGITPATAPSP